MPQPLNRHSPSKTKLPSSAPQRGIARPAILVVLVLWMVVLAAIVLNRQNLYDWWQLRNYHAPAAISALAGQDTMTAYGRRVYLVNHPVIEAKQSFKSVCPNGGGEQTIVLGCYHGNQRGIFLLNVNDSRLDGVEQVTAAHEMLHAAYDRLSLSEKQRINGLLYDYYANGLHDKRLIDTLNAYKKTEPNDVVNEMHSIFGTEVASLPPALETYYRKYFTNRSQVAKFAAQYQAEFTSRQDQVIADDAKLTVLKQQIKTISADLDAKSSEITARQKALLSQRSSGNLTAYNAGVPAYNALIDSYNSELNNLKSVISGYNQLVTARNQVALEQDQLVNELSTHATPINK
jgi:hypothetical protein